MLNRWRAVGDVGFPVYSCIHLFIFFIIYIHCIRGNFIFGQCMYLYMWINLYYIFVSYVYHVTSEVYEIVCQHKGVIWDAFSNKLLGDFFTVL